MTDIALARHLIYEAELRELDYPRWPNRRRLVKALYSITDNATKSYILQQCGHGDIIMEILNDGIERQTRMMFEPPRATAAQALARLEGGPVLTQDVGLNDAPAFAELDALGYAKRRDGAWIKWNAPGQLYP